METIDVGDTCVKLSLTTSPELDFIEGIKAKNFVEDAFPIGSDVLVDDAQIEESHERLIGRYYIKK